MKDAGHGNRDIFLDGDEMYNSLSVKYFILTARKTPALVGRLAGERQPIILAILAALSSPVWMICWKKQVF
ncbi:hypothetical protein [Microcoleus sp. BROC3]|uniref:hypothetical protein n=1 Tax=Microcoleus sp. BROC3 TaxID=3055323 RepID=UPI002FD1BB7A